MRCTKAADKIGQRTAYAVVRWMVDLDDPKAEGNLGGEGFDDDSEERRFPTAGLARAWCQRRGAALAKLPKHRNVTAEVVVERWDEDIYDDPTYGRIRDAERVAETEQYGYLGDDGTWSWDAPAGVN